MSTTWKEAIANVEAPSGPWVMRRLIRSIVFVVVLMIATATGVTDWAIELVQYAATSDVASVRSMVLWLCLAGVLIWLAFGVLVEMVVSVLYYKRNHERETRFAAYLNAGGPSAGTRASATVGSPRARPEKPAPRPARVEEAPTEFLPSSEIAGQGDLLDCIPGEERGTEAIAARLEASECRQPGGDKEAVR
ncbi:hypothetical protein GSY69_06920 [Brevibacterium sp. 5221]|uniref:Uncharacterized protein n=1 Tax=Brevibacterium rongguiense TaxID=2695267 RepID=A0A6N9H6H1_9MICO|nr:hypothetical protein [Brevibacterium rongguiense]MYM19707.1 hypothetical protein [Brevibacterium rongguiense]